MRIIINKAVNIKLAKVVQSIRGIEIWWQKMWSTKSNEMAWSSNAINVNNVDHALTSSTPLGLDYPHARGRVRLVRGSSKPFNKACTVLVILVLDDEKCENPRNAHAEEPLRLVIDLDQDSVKTWDTAVRWICADDLGVHAARAGKVARDMARDGGKKDL